jgi:hypothetical protein
MGRNPITLPVVEVIDADLIFVVKLVDSAPFYLDVESCPQVARSSHLDVLTLEKAYLGLRRDLHRERRFF